MCLKQTRLACSSFSSGTSSFISMRLKLLRAGQRLQDTGSRLVHRHPHAWHIGGWWGSREAGGAQGRLLVRAWHKVEDNARHSHLGQVPCHRKPPRNAAPTRVAELAATAATSAPTRRGWKPRRPCASRRYAQKATRTRRRSRFSRKEWILRVLDN